MRIFLSYASADRDLVRPLAGGLVERGYNVWWDQDIRAGDNWADAIESALAATDVAILVVTANSASSRAVQAEMRKAAAAALRVIPVVGPDTAFDVLPENLRSIQAIRLGPDVSVAIDLIASSVERFHLDERSLAVRQLKLHERPYLRIAESLSHVSRRVDFAGNALDGVFDAVVGYLPTLPTEVVVRIVLPDPTFFEEPGGGRDLEIASRSLASLRAVRNVTRPEVSVRLVKRLIGQSILIVDDVSFLDPLPGSGQPIGLLEFTRAGAARTLFDATEKSFDATFGESSVAVGSQVVPKVDTGPDIRSLLATGDPRDMEFAAQLYFAGQGYQVTAGVRSRDSEIDMVLVDNAGDVAVVEVKQWRRPIGLEVVRSCVAKAAEVGAARAILFTNQRLSRDAEAEIVALAERTGITFQTIITDVLLEGHGL